MDDPEPTPGKMEGHSHDNSRLYMAAGNQYINIVVSEPTAGSGKSGHVPPARATPLRAVGLGASCIDFSYAQDGGPIAVVPRESKEVLVRHVAEGYLERIAHDLEDRMQNSGSYGGRHWVRHHCASVDISSDGTSLMVRSNEEEIFFWRLTSRGHYLQWRRRMSGRLAINPSGATFAIGGGKRGVDLYDADGPARVRTFGTRTALQGLLFSPDGRRLISWGYGGDIHVADVESETVAHVLHHGEVAIPPRGFVRRLASWVNSKAVLYGVTCSERGEILASAGVDGFVRAWRLDERVPVQLEPLRPATPVASLVISSDGRTLATATGADMHIWDLASGEMIKTLSFPDLVTCLLFDGVTNAFIAACGGKLIPYPQGQC